MGAGIAMGSHLLFSSIGEIRGDASIVFFLGSILLGQLLKRFKCPISLTADHESRLSIIAIALLGLVCCIGIVGWLFHYGSEFSLDTVDEYEKLHRGEAPIILTILTRWGMYAAIGWYGFSGYGSMRKMLMVFAITVIAQVLTIPLNVFTELYKQVSQNCAQSALEWMALNRAYLGYGAALSSLILLSMAKDEKSKLRFVLGIGSLFCVLITILCGSRGPLGALIIGILFITRKKWFRSYRSSLLCLCALAIGSFLVIPEILPCGLKKQFYDRTGSYSIRHEVIDSKFASKIIAHRSGVDSNLAKYIVGKGFGSSRLDENKVFAPTNSGTHIFLLDVYLETGFLGVCAFLTAMILAFMSFHRRTRTDSKTYELSILALIILVTKLTLSSDTYSEPLFAIFLFMMIATGTMGKKILVSRTN